MTFQITVLGCSSATPTSLRHPSSQVLNINENLFLIDCGEAAQMQLKRFKIRFSKIDHIFISHLHGDHYLGLMGLLSTLHLNDREKTLHIYAPPEIKNIINYQLGISDVRLKYDIVYHELNFQEIEPILSEEEYTVHSFPLNHRIPTCGFYFKEKPRPLKINKEFLELEKIPFEQFPLIKSGSDYTNPSGKVYINKDITFQSLPPRSYAYSSDTAYIETYLDLIQNVDILYHEATFMHDLYESAKDKYHSTTIDAATIAVKANAKKLIIGHYSARYTDLAPLLEEAQSVFANTYLAEEGKTYCWNE